MIPFLVLAVGVDNIFIIVQTMDRIQKKEGEAVEDHIGRVVGHVAPTMLLSTTAEALCFFLGEYYYRFIRQRDFMLMSNAIYE